MFYDIDILNRRGGKFGVIWLAANQKLKLTGKGSKNDLRLVLKVDVGKIWYTLFNAFLIAATKLFSWAIEAKTSGATLSFIQKEHCFKIKVHVSRSTFRPCSATEPSSFIIAKLNTMLVGYKLITC